MRAGEEIDGIAAPDAKYVQIREYHADDAPNPPGRFVIERLGGEPTAPPRLNGVRDAQAFAWGNSPR